MNIRSALFLLSLLLLYAPAFSQKVFFHESFEDTDYNKRGWYDNSKLVITNAEHALGTGACLAYHFLVGARVGTDGGGIRRQFDTTEEVYLSYWIKYSANWTGSNKPYHPHEFSFTTTEDDKYVGPAWTNLTLYIEENEGRPMLAIQDGRNIDTMRIKEDLGTTTELRAVSGCNGSSDQYPAGDCYRSGNYWYNGKVWKAGVVTFTQTPGRYFQNDWHHVEAYFRLNSIVAAKAVADGAAQYWFDDSLLIDAQSVMMRTAKHPAMKFNQFLIVPYIGDGSPIDQTMWVDEITVGSSRPVKTSVEEEKVESDAIVLMKLYDILGNELAAFEGSRSSSREWLSGTRTMFHSAVYILQEQSARNLKTQLLFQFR
jgi:hypothetical protein